MFFTIGFKQCLNSNKKVDYLLKKVFIGYNFFNKKKLLKMKRFLQNEKHVIF